ncbi:hybrid sensor histidine kinase/response regulator [Candidatus Deferrimicrobium sp.]|uniref:hybrid sensor histidine kinase/response regulator n=1 Tax=Candidatus Deferrimicrobium sp. TaxID=3060586 RepID=UPI003C64A663
MTDKDDDFRKKLLEMFRVEAGEHAAVLSSGLIELEKAELPEEARGKILEVIYRDAHSLKGAARAVDLGAIESVCQQLETVFAALKRGEIDASSGLYDLLHRAVDAVDGFARSVGSGDPGSVSPRVAEITRSLEEYLRGLVAPSPREEREKTPKGEPKGEPAPNEPTGVESSLEAPGPAGSTVRVSSEKLDCLLIQAEELLFVKNAFRHLCSTIGEAGAALKNRRKEGQIEEVVKTVIHQLDTLGMQARADSWIAGGMADALLDNMKKAMMLPCSHVLEILPKIARDLSRQGSKEVVVAIDGKEIEIDKRILEEMKDPFIHILRNSIDHGIETPAEREKGGKPRRGKIAVSISRRDGKRIEVSVSDDGRGIDAGKVRATAVKAGILSPGEAASLTDEEMIPLVFRSGVSTSPIITEISGRGLGLAIVREKVEALGGSVFIDSAPGKGSTIRILLPVTLATFRGILVRADGHAFILPTMNVERVLRVKREEIGTAENRETISHEGEALSLVHLGDVLELPRGGDGNGASPFTKTIILSYGGIRIAFAVDEIGGEQEVLLKGLRKPLLRVRNVAGATILGGGGVVPVLNVADLMKSATRAAGHGRESLAMSGEKKTAERKSILVVEDSITSRTLLKNILEAAGYRVTTAVDGVEGMTKLKTDIVDLVVSDVEMPRMNGFILTAKIREDRKLSELPVVLVTALESREDRERGIDAGANAYIVKSNFDQSNLLGVIRRLA